MPAKSKAQQRFFGVVKGIQKGGIGGGKAKKAAKDMDPKDVDDFASTKHKGLPNRVKQETKVRNLIKKMVREMMMNEESWCFMGQCYSKEEEGVDEGVWKKVTETTVRLAPKKDVNFHGNIAQIVGKKAMMGLDKKSLITLLKALRMHASLTFKEGKIKEGKLTEGKVITLPNGIKVKISFGKITLMNRGKKIELDRGEAQKFGDAIKKHMRIREKVNLGSKSSVKSTVKDMFAGTTEDDELEEVLPAALAALGGRAALGNLAKDAAIGTAISSFDEDDEEIEEFMPGVGVLKKQGEIGAKYFKRRKMEGGPGSGRHPDDEENPFDREPSDDELADIEKQFEAKKRDYKAEYKKYGSSKKAKKYRAELNKYNRQKGTYGNGDGKDASHKGGKIVGFEEQSKNRGRAEKSRLKKEGKLTEAIGKGMKWEDLKVGTVIHWDIGVHYKVTKLSKNKLSSKKHNVLKSAQKHIFADKYNLNKRDFEDSVKKGFIRSLTNTNPRIKEGKLTEAKETIFDVANRVVKNHQSEKYKGSRLDATTANLLMKVYKKVSPKMKKHLAKMGASNPSQLVQTLWALVK